MSTAQDEYYKRVRAEVVLQDEAVQESTEQPIYAEIVGEVGTLAGGHETTARLVVFGRGVPFTFNRRDDAVAWVNDWNAHLSNEWLAVRETVAEIMRRFITALLQRGVTNQCIDLSLEDVKHHAEGD